MYSEKVSVTNKKTSIWNKSSQKELLTRQKPETISAIMMMHSQINVTLTFTTIHGHQGESILLQHLPVMDHINLGCESRYKYCFWKNYYTWVLYRKMLSHDPE